jgi:ketosteroid isomerase-like protein
VSTGEALIRELLRATDAGDQAAGDALLAEDVRFRFGNGAEVNGKRELIAARPGGIRASIAGMHHEIVAIVESGDVVCAELIVTYTRRDGSTVAVPCCDVFRLREGLIADYRIYIDVSPVLAGV